MPYYQIDCGTGQRYEHAASCTEAVDKVFGKDGWKWNGLSEVEVPGNPGHVGRYRVRGISKNTYEFWKSGGRT